MKCTIRSMLICIIGCTVFLSHWLLVTNDLVPAMTTSQLILTSAHDNSDEILQNNTYHKEPTPNDMKQLLPTTAVIIDAGHGGVDGGAINGSVYEKDINLEVGKKLYAALVSQGVPTILNRTHDYALSDDNRWHRTSSRHLRDLSQRMGLTREIDHLVFVSLHVNSVASKRAHGPLILHQSTGESAMLAHHIQEELNFLYDTHKRPIAVKSFYVLKYVKSPAVLVEMGFISNPNDLERLTSNVGQTKIAKSIADGILHYLWVN